MFQILNVRKKASILMPAMETVLECSRYLQPSGTVSATGSARATSSLASSGSTGPVSISVADSAKYLIESFRDSARSSVSSRSDVAVSSEDDPLSVSSGTR